MSYFIISCARSGTTSIAKILNLATNGVCVLEPTPNLNVESRLMMDGKLKDPYKAIQPIIQRVKNKKTEIYGEKNVTYSPFIPHLYDELECKFVYMKRDGRDVVRSLIDWHNQLWGNIYRESVDIGNISPKALQSAGNLPIHKDTSDYARPRPNRKDPLYDEWLNLTKFEMCAYYWSFINEYSLNQLGKIPEKAWIEVDYTNPSTEDIQNVIDFLELEGIPKNRIDSILENKVNSLKDRIGRENDFPDWKNWNEELRTKFDRLASKTMTLLGYYLDEGTNWRPQGYGETWKTHENAQDWYSWMYEDRRLLHEGLLSWIKTKTLETIGDFGCGHAVGYSEALQDYSYTGIDLSEQNIEYCRQNNENPKHQYLLRDFLENPLPENTFDLAFSMGTIDNSYDVTGFLKTMLESSMKWIYLTCFTGWFPFLQEHKYQWNEEERCYYNHISPNKIRRTLEELGCKHITVAPAASGKTDPKYETLIIAKKVHPT